MHTPAAAPLTAAAAATIILVVAAAAILPAIVMAVAVVAATVFTLIVEAMPATATACCRWPWLSLRLDHLVARSRCAQPVRAASARSQCTQPVRAASARSQCAQPVRARARYDSTTWSRTASAGRVRPVGATPPPLDAARSQRYDSTT